jgi:hypothetical protein
VEVADVAAAREDLAAASRILVDQGVTPNRL